MGWTGKLTEKTLKIFNRKITSKWETCEQARHLVVITQMSPALSCVSSTSRHCVHWDYYASVKSNTIQCRHLTLLQREDERRVAAVVSVCQHVGGAGGQEDSRDGGGDRQQECPDSLCRDGALLQCSHSTEGPLPRTWVLLGSLLCTSDDSE